MRPQAYPVLVSPTGELYLTLPQAPCPPASRRPGGAGRKGLQGPGSPLAAAGGPHRTASASSPCRLPPGLEPLS